MNEIVLCRIVPTFGMIMGLIISCLFSTQIVASTIPIDITGNFRNGISDITITDGKNKDVKITVNEPGGTDGTIASGTTDNVGGYSSGDLAGLTAGASSVDIEVGGEHFKGVTKDGIYTSEEQKKKAKGLQATFNELPFDFFGSFVTFEGDLFGQLQLMNNSTEFAFDFSSLILFTGLDLSFFNPIEYASISAMASGTMAYDFLSLNGGEASIPLAGGSASPILTFPTGPLSYDKYILLAGTARPIIGQDQYGDEIMFTVAAANVPEPASIVLFGIAFIVLVFRRSKMVDALKTTFD
jgi:hypothetical protein